MYRLFCSVLLAAIFAGSGSAQFFNRVKFVTTAPSGSCSGDVNIYVTISTGVMTVCKGGIYGAPPGGAASAGGVPGQLQVNAGGSLGGITAGGDITFTSPNFKVTAINGVALAGLATGILKNTTTTGAPSIAVAGDFPTLNQDTTGRSANVTGVVAEANGGTGSNNAPGAAGHYLRSNGTHYVDSSIQAGDIPATGVAAGSCGDATHSCGLTIDATGRISLQTNNAISGSSANSVSCTGINATADTAALTTAATTAGVWSFPSHGTCLINGVTVSQASDWLLNGTTLKHNTGDTGNMLTITANAVLDGGIFDVNGQDITTGIQPGLIAVTSGADPEIKNSTCLNSGTTQTSVDCLFTYQSSVNFHDNSVQNTIVGCSQAQVWISTIPAGGVIRLDHNTIDGGNCNQIFSQFADITSQQFITNNIFTNALAQAGSTGSTGNAVDIFQSNGLATIQGNRFYNPQFSAVRLNESGTDSLHALVANNVVQSAGEVSLYCEFGCEDVNFIGNKVLDGDAGVECTNVSSRNNSAPCQITGNTFMNMKAYGVHIEQDSAVGNTFTNMPVGVEAFFSTPNLISMNNFTNVTVPVAADTGLTGVQQVGGNALSTVSSSTNWSVLAQVTPQGHQSFAMHTQADLAISNITQATQAALTFDSTTIPTVGAVYLLRNVYGMVQSDGLECTIAASPAPTATTATCSGLNSLGFTAYANGPYGSSGRAWGNLLYSAGTTPAFSLPAAIVGLQ